MDTPRKRTGEIIAFVLGVWFLLSLLGSESACIGHPWKSWSLMPDSRVERLWDEIRHEQNRSRRINDILYGRGQ